MDDTDPTSFGCQPSDRTLDDDEPMGHRALVAYGRADGTYSLHHSQWGALGFALSDDLGPDSPFGADADWEQAAHEALVDGERPEVPPDHDAPVDPEPRGSIRALDGLPKRFDFLEYEAAFVVSRTGDVRAFQPCWFARALDDAEPMGDGALVSVRRGRDPVRDAARISAWFRGVADTVRVLHECGTVDEPTAREHLRTRLREWAAEGRTVLLAS
ncbi:DUF6735 family protein [Haloarchaeobius iranensis]|uniref:Uncharacterized protein n=1 Tax=Haloarchaeobius iranensis TaxID=996166 RepID=A0A1G9UET9_9EURY|nr:DUF6735 family protein [Haloarchaeobius iranensis]SDM58045.1 hypothetical protein SAMN05192554_10476 [Haloarchaeobius iranensis]